MIENLNDVINYIKDNGLIEKGDRIGIGVSGGGDSMALLHFLNAISDELEFKLVAVNVNHCIRKGSAKDSSFVKNYCKVNNIVYVGYKVDVPAYAGIIKVSVEQAARIKRYECFEMAAKKYKLTKFALAHHAGDQAETILLHIFRGSGIAGARGMDAQRGIYIRPFLETQKSDIVAYLYKNQIPYITDESNMDNSYARNFLRNQIIPTLQQEWRSVEKNIIAFGQNCRSDDEYLNSLVSGNGLTTSPNNVRVALNYFAYPYAVISRILISAFEKITARENIEKKHIDLICLLAKTGENGSRLDLPNNLYAVKEYEYITIVRKGDDNKTKTLPFKTGKSAFPNYGTVTVTKTISWKPALANGLMVVDADKLPRTAKWRTRQGGDTFTKFGGGAKALSAYLIDKKIPVRLRDRLPVLAAGNEIYAIAGVEVSQKVAVDRDTAEAFVLEFIRD